MSNPELGRKVQVQMMLTSRILERLDERAARDAPEGVEPNRSREARRLLTEALDREDEARAAAGDARRVTG